MYTAKRGGRERSCCTSPGVSKTSLRNHGRRKMFFLQIFVQAGASRKPRPRGKPNPNPWCFASHPLLGLAGCSGKPQTLAQRGPSPPSPGFHRGRGDAGSFQRHTRVPWEGCWLRGDGKGVMGRSWRQGQPHAQHWPGRDFQPLSEPAKQTRAKSSRVM